MSKIQFKINYEVSQKRKFERFIELYQKEIGYEIQNLKIERYWKIEGQFQAGFYIETDKTEKKEIVFEVLTFANKLWSTGFFNWTFNGPHENDTLIFECFLNNENDDQPIKWAHIEIENG